MRKLTSLLKNNRGLILLFILQIPLILPFFHKGFFPSHDDVQITRVFEIFQSLKYGDVPPRWSANLLFGYGYPLYIFYGPLSYLTGAFFVYFVGNFLVATKIVFILSFLIGPLGVYLLVKQWWNKLPALVAALAFSYAPYRAVDVYVRGNLGEFFSFSLFPLVFYFNWKYLNSDLAKRKIWGLVFCLFLAFTEVSHNISCFIFFLFLLAFNVFFILTFRRKDWLKEFFSIGRLFFFSLMMSAFYLIPLLFESRYVLVSQFLDSPYADYFLTLKKLWSSPWGWGGYTDETNAVSLQLGKTLVISALFASMFNFFSKNSHKKLISFFCFILIFFIFMEIRASDFIWRNISLLHYFQFPWRFHIIICLLLSFLCGSLIYLMETFCSSVKKGKLITILISLIFIVVLITENIGYFKPRIYWNAPSVSETTTWNDEYLPKWVKVKPKDYASEKITIAGGSGKVIDLKWGYLIKEFVIEAKNPINVRITQIFYPGWQVYIDGNRGKISYENVGGLMEVSIPSGKHFVRFVFEKTIWRTVSDAISLTGLLLFFLLLIKEIFKLKPRDRK